MAVTLSLPATSPDGPPRVVLSVGGDTATVVTITRTRDGVTTPVRGASAVAPPAWPFVVIDYEAPPGESVYTVTTDVGSDSKTAALAPGECVWLVPLANPATGAVRVDLASHSGFGPSIIVDAVTTLGGSVERPNPAVVAVGGVSAESGTVQFRTTTTAQMQALMLLMGQTVWVSHDPDHGLGPFYAIFAPDKAERFVNVADRQDRTMAARYFVQARPESLTSGAVTWLDVSLRFDEFDDLAAEYGTFDAFWADAITWTS